MRPATRSNSSSRKFDEPHADVVAAVVDLAGFGPRSPTGISGLGGPDHLHAVLCHEPAEDLDRCLRPRDDIGWMEIRPWPKRTCRGRNERRLGGLGNRRQCGEARRCRNVEPGACKSILKTMSDIQTQPVDKYRDSAGRRRGGRTGHIRAGIRHRADRILQRTGTVVEPLPVQRAARLPTRPRDPRAAYGRERPDDGIVGSPAASA